MQNLFFGNPTCREAVSRANVMSPFPVASHRLLVILKTRGPQTTAELGVVLGITRAAVRSQLTKLAAEGLAAATSEPTCGVGRPAQFWSLTSEGNARFPDAHADLTIQLMRVIRTQLGELAVERLIEAQAAESLSGYMKAMEDAGELQNKVARLAELRSREGYMAEWYAEGDAYVLVENHCPICTAAKACPGLCQSEIETFRKVLGDGVSVERTELISNGDRRCTYRIRHGP
jgi:predicted ArsR family transcriptional regulator